MYRAKPQRAPVGMLRGVGQKITQLRKIGFRDANAVILNADDEIFLCFFSADPDMTDSGFSSRPWNTQFSTSG